jgi:hypothetical protein
MPAGGFVSRVFSSVFTDSDQMPNGSFDDSLCGIAILFPSGDQLSPNQPFFPTSCILLTVTAMMGRRSARE